ncbi:CcmD family protein [Segetibacter sp. 3557_3]|uniref:CcmD family protein n=1 Tax=Segetibacter sp. 3557_3 TaxID=2547429 RepID=UPI001058B1DF|nr:CcmD family protein [Segetibacter sp. 3557_3]TDH27905.1 CcmD family protein [Segetibacter sp. 3557_3]
MHRWKNWLLVLASLLFQIGVYAQDAAGADKGEGFMRTEGKIYVVMVVVLTILAGMLVYLVRLDRKISNLEKGNNNP